MSNHTKEPWRVELVDMENDEKICITSHAFDIVSPHVPKAIRKIEDAERIVQCVNACADMEDPAKEIAQLRADRAELLKLVNELYARIDCSMEKHIEYEELIKRMEVGE
jgi:uncharacterized protein with PhoU and TrkA domain